MTTTNKPTTLPVIDEVRVAAQAIALACGQALTNFQALDGALVRALGEPAGDSCRGELEATREHFAAIAERLRAIVQLWTGRIGGRC